MSNVQANHLISLIKTVQNGPSADFKEANLLLTDFRNNPPLHLIIEVLASEDTDVVLFGLLTLHTSVKKLKSPDMGELLNIYNQRAWVPAQAHLLHSIMGLALANSWENPPIYPLRLLTADPFFPDVARCLAQELGNRQGIGETLKAEFCFLLDALEYQHLDVLEAWLRLLPASLFSLDPQRAQPLLDRLAQVFQRETFGLDQLQVEDAELVTFLCQQYWRGEFDPMAQQFQEIALAALGVLGESPDLGTALTYNIPLFSILTDFGELAVHTAKDPRSVYFLQACIPCTDVFQCLVSHLAESFETRRANQDWCLMGLAASLIPAMVDGFDLLNDECFQDASCKICLEIYLAHLENPALGPSTLMDYLNARLKDRPTAVVALSVNLCEAGLEYHQQEQVVNLIWQMAQRLVDVPADEDGLIIFPEIVEGAQEAILGSPLLVPLFGVLSALAAQFRILRGVLIYLCRHIRESPDLNSQCIPLVQHEYLAPCLLILDPNIENALARVLGSSQKFPLMIDLMDQAKDWSASSLLPFLYCLESLVLNQPSDEALEAYVKLTGLMNTQSSSEDHPYYLEKFVHVAHQILVNTQKIQILDILHKLPLELADFQEHLRVLYELSLSVLSAGDPSADVWCTFFRFGRAWPAAFLRKDFLPLVLETGLYHPKAPVVDEAVQGLQNFLLTAARENRPNLEGTLEDLQQAGHLSPKDGSPWVEAVAHWTPSIFRHLLFNLRRYRKKSLFNAVVEVFICLREKHPFEFQTSVNALNLDASVKEQLLHLENPKLYPFFKDLQKFLSQQQAAA